MYEATTDGLLILRYLLGVRGPALVAGVVGTNAHRTTEQAITQYLDFINQALDVDANTQSDAVTDGLMILRYLFGLRGDAVTANALGGGATRSGAQIETYIQSRMP